MQSDIESGGRSIFSLYRRADRVIGGIVVLATAIAAMTFIASASGCAATPAARWAQARETLTTAETQLTLAAKTGQLQPDDIKLADIGVQTARQALADAEKQLPAGGSGFDSDMSLIRAAVHRLAVYYAVKEATK